MTSQLKTETQGSGRATGIASTGSPINLKLVDADEDADPTEVPVQSEIVNSWWMERIEISCRGQAFCLKVSDILYHEKSPYQDILVFKSEDYGNVLVLDGIVNCTERDEFSYQEMMTHVALCSHPNPKSVLIIGGGDGGVAREVVKHGCVERVVQCEIDEKVVEVSRRYLPGMAVGFDDPKMQLYIGDGFEFMKQHVDEFDVIITDSSDPIGPAESLFQASYYELVNKALKADGILSSQGESMWIPMVADYILPLIRQLKDQLFPVVSYCYTYIPTYTTSQIGVLLASKNQNTRFEKPLRILSDETKEKMKLRYYNEDMHRASFQLPQFIKKIFTEKS